MDTLLHERLKLGSPPFDGACLHLIDFIPIEELRRLLIPIVDLLQQNSGETPIYRFDDWHEHDGYITQRELTTWSNLIECFVSEDSLFASRHGDDCVRWSYYPEDFSFLFRYYLLTEDDHPSYPGRWGDFDLCGSIPLLRSVQESACASLTKQLALTNAKEYFDKNYGG